MNREAFNRFCSSLTATTHVVQWGNSDVWKVGGKVFAICWGGDEPVPGITFKTSEMDYEILRVMPGLRPAPYFATRGMKWIQRFEASDFTEEDLQCAIAESYRLVALKLSRKKRAELGLEL